MALEEIKLLVLSFFLGEGGVIFLEIHLGELLVWVTICLTICLNQEARYKCSPLRLDTDWCCSDNDCNGFWFNAHHPEEDWLEAWRKVAKMSSPYKAVVGAGLKNEIRAMISGKSWGSGAFCSADVFDRGPLEVCIGGGVFQGVFDLLCNNRGAMLIHAYPCLTSEIWYLFDLF